ncbi:uncharacterized protein LOC110006606 isoform X3 [Amborella trichopoda]|uniref:uncharacterized protein LOC110006606 isoform X3 n=1 Tax=Amborella trichopoda TaxID=13333 RepID=UPI0009BDBD92|nr:uncharacterized protein LOC110006606 isoform X3 [Amborella trichopoda]XP_020518342.1 uncharacterized protein LOC110006606 isoform X3 [Amborella trichopoda]|eukprot:XP_020518341.1 uncharacterized protein LOC110006606 isoform X3 [Amborella trichopoda]
MKGIFLRWKKVGYEFIYFDDNSLLELDLSNLMYFRNWVWIILSRLILMIKNDSSCHRSNSLLQKSFKGNISNRAPQENFRRMLGVKTHLSVGFPLTSRVPRSGHIMKYAFDNFDDLFAHSFYLPI